MILIFCIVSGALIKCYNLQLETDERVKILAADASGLITVLTTIDRLFVYSLKGGLCSSSNYFRQENPLRVITAMLQYDKFKPNFVKIISSKYISLDFLY